MNVTTRPAEQTDRAFARQTHHAAYREVVEAQFGNWVEADQDRWFDAGWQAAPHAIVLCDGVPCGYVCMDEKPDSIDVREIVIDPAFQRRGIGSRVLRDVLERARERGVCVRLGTFHANRAANLYRRLGFRDIGHTSTHLLFEWCARSGDKSNVTAAGWPA